MSDKKAFHRVLLTGAAGNLGKELRVRAARYADIVRLSDHKESKDKLEAHEEFVACDLADKKSVYRVVEGVDAILHFGAVSTEHSFEDILGPNICGTYHIYEAARKHGSVKRIIFASSNHVIGFHRRGELLETDCLRKPDSYYGLSKSYGEDLATFYWHRYGVETVSIRIGTSFPEPPSNVRMLSTWLSFNDLDQLIFKALTAKDVGHTVVFGASNSPSPYVWWSNRLAAHLGYAPADSSASYVDKVVKESAGKPDPGHLYQGGKFTEMGPFED